MAEIRTITPFGLTAKGLALQIKVQAGQCPLELTGAAIGDGYLEDGQSEITVTEMVHEIPSQVTGADGDKPRVDFTRVYKSEDEDGRPVCMVGVTVQNGSNETTAIREFIVYANDPDEGKIAYGYTNLGDSAYPFPKYNNREHVSYDWNISTYVSNADNVTANITFTAGTTHEEFEQHIQNTDDPHTIEFTEAADVANIASGEKMSVIFGKIKRAITALMALMTNVIPISQKGSAGGVAELDENGHVLSSQLPPYVDDVLEYDSISAFPSTGESGKIYVDLATNLAYRWSGTQYTEISPSIALGETSSTAYRGDRGAAAYAHAQSAHAPSNANYYVHPSSHSAGMINETTDRQFVTAAQKLKIDGVEAGAEKHKAPTADEIAAAISMTPSEVVRAILYITGAQQYSLQALAAGTGTLDENKPYYIKNDNATSVGSIILGYGGSEITYNGDTLAAGGEYIVELYYDDAARYRIIAALGGDGA